MENQLHEECGVFGVFSNKDAEIARTVYYGLFALQHRGQESSGIAINKGGKISHYKDSGLVEDVFTSDIIDGLGTGNIAVGHVRYGTAETIDRINAQPIVVNHVKGKMAIAQNGTLMNTHVLREELEMRGSIFHTTSDTEVIAHTVIKERLSKTSIEEAICEAMNKLVGAYCIVAMSVNKLIAARDPHGFRPLCYGQTEDGTYIVASESCALDAVSAKLIREVEPGEIVIFDKNGVRNITEHCGEKPKKLCIFEYVYFARPDSIIEGMSVHAARIKAGVCLAMEHPVQADVVIGVPDSGLDAAIGYARQSGIPYGIGFIKNKYIGRTFIAPGQKNREDKVGIKLNPVSETVKGKRVVLVDDSIVRGTTAGKIVKLLRDAGAKEVHFMSAAPPFIDLCYYGTDIDSKDALIACKHSVEEIRDIIGVDSLGYLSVENLPMLIGTRFEQGYCDACFTGKHPTKLPQDFKTKAE